jgi:hypothetical protein
MATSPFSVVAKYTAEAVLSIVTWGKQENPRWLGEDPAEPEGGRVCDGDGARCCGGSAV